MSTSLATVLLCRRCFALKPPGDFRPAKGEALRRLRYLRICKDCAKQYTRGGYKTRITSRVAVSAEARFWKYVDKTNYCWLWTGGTVDGGYGKFSYGGKKNAKTIGAHQFSYTLHYGPIPKGLFVLHKCDNRPCVRPDHLFLGTHKDNMEDMARKKRGSRGLNHHLYKRLLERQRDSLAQPIESAPNPTRKKLDWEKVNAIRAMFATGRYTCKDLAPFFEVCRSTIHEVVTFKTWKPE